jgi:hypothetical protein
MLCANQPKGLNFDVRNDLATNGASEPQPTHNRSGRTNRGKTDPYSCKKIESKDKIGRLATLKIQTQDEVGLRQPAVRQHVFSLRGVVWNVTDS